MDSGSPVSLRTQELEVDARNGSTRRLETDQWETNATDAEWVVVSKARDSSDVICNSFVTKHELESVSSNTTKCAACSNDGCSLDHNGAIVVLESNRNCVSSSDMRRHSRQVRRHREKCQQCLESADWTIGAVIDELETERPDVETIKELKRRLCAQRELLLRHSQSMHHEEIRSDDLKMWTRSDQCDVVIQDLHSSDLPIPRASNDDHRPAVLEQYFNRTADASIAAERIAELDDMAHSQSQLQALSMDGSSISAFEEPSYKMRRSALEDDLRKAEEDARNLKSECIARGLSPERARQRRRSTLLVEPGEYELKI